MSKYGVISGPCSPVFGVNTKIYEQVFIFSPNTGKYGPEITPYLDTSRSDSSSHRRCSVKIGVLKISQNSQENTCTRVSFWIKLQSTWYRCGPVNFAKFLRTLFAEHLWPTVVVNKLDRGGFYHRRPLPLTIFTYC